MEDRLGIDYQQVQQFVSVSPWNVRSACRVLAATDAASCLLDWRLFVPEFWDEICVYANERAESIMARWVKAQIPATQHHRTK